MDFIQANLIDPVNKALYTYILVYLLVAVGIYFTIRTRFVQFRYFPRMLKQLVHSRTHDAGISPFQAFCVGLASGGHRQHRRCCHRADRRRAGRDLLDVGGRPHRHGHRP